MFEKTVSKLRERKQQSEKFSVVAAYDATFAKAIADAGVDAILVGDSLGMLVQGKRSTVPVSIEHMAYHTAAVVRGNEASASPTLVIADMPFMSYQSTALALDNAGKLMRAGANMVKLEGGEWLYESVRQLVQNGVPVCAHLGLTPQSVNKFGGFKVQGKSDSAKQRLLADGKALQEAGADFLVLECIPAALACEVTAALSISTIGIGAGSDTDAQVLVAHDLLGLGDSPARFVKNFLTADNIGEENPVRDAFAAFDNAVKTGSYPAPEHSYK
ncbi:MAG: 3-methyl-2-oxobutanoate hydroxymethyltransferase [Gammaproteobacteria bacterium]|nr:3-methyl-2-oxobutanoate hydroxymethyltransferase [Gammaproteobacteria bacterium]MBT8151369.1 3-methyl-2-oxobutanoate hydroxymethyltransferase [Gammaproteobacteria bacterium]NND38438.1 3-methyl-2-oxobutanoate hydroxymethyltransferase [Pseudomonadales bacterium]NNM11053.1 3-methyl-2-oxobutanoate hydroxymethyltransferase [Pseudomonadales bacterium]RZV58493.1 MAG: 3-methyl-2-oxobutanoate hydroxymethyltransferase [Pseudomonadales bacterium]